MYLWLLNADFLLVYLGALTTGCIYIKKENVKYFHPATTGSFCDQRDHPATIAIILGPARSSCDQRDHPATSAILGLVH